MSAVPVRVIGGYLGAGKTTLLNALLEASTGERIVVLVNDFGSVNIDARFVGSRAGDTIELTNGCACCTIGDDLALAVHRALERSPLPDRIYVEASGVADPRRIGERLAAVAGVCVEAPLVVADAQNVVERARDRYVGELVCRQLAGAGALYLSKLDLVDEERAGAVREFLAEIAAGVPTSERDALRPEPEFESTTVYYDGPIDRALFIAEAQALTRTHHRAKGMVSFTDEPGRSYIFQLAGSTWSLEPAGEGEAARDGFVVAIAPRSDCA